MRSTVLLLFLFTSASLATALPDISGSDEVPQACPGPWAGATPSMAVCEHLSGVRESSRGNRAAAEAHYRAALVLWERLSPPHPDLQSATMISLADLLTVSSRMKEAEGLLVKAREMAPPLRLPSVLGHLGSFYSHTANPERGRPLAQEALRLFEQTPAPDRNELAYAWNALGMIDLSAGQYASAETSFRTALGLAGAAPEASGYQANLGLALYNQGRYYQAEVTLEHSLPPSAGTQRATILGNLAIVAAAQNKFGTAEDLAEQALITFQRTLAPTSPEVVTMQVTLGAIYLRERKTAQAEKILPEAVRLERSMPLDPRLQADAIHRLADLRAQQKRWAEAESLYREALAIYERRLGPSHPDLVAIRRDMAQVSRAARTSHPA